ncbi:thiamine pyrophosphate-binding protein [Metabacillus malikii]|uniref:Acetolactate synthase-1/2/3 large subunit n=1 Tax=Metabacillus malikii TaxID=1504265 RepID=A0ABT9ZB00_9BACI|nr:thiamine pyrophosphate-binding protein [Metabacillus malikii]MDQ0229438.1 acetolactate synthase-1/2/3 large subunit [Metabacillus malikii]
MKAIRAVLDYLKAGGVEVVFGIPAGSVNAFFDELYDIPEITPIIVKHEGAASYMAASYAKYSKSMSVCIGCSGPGGTNLITGAANAMREHLPILFLTGAVPVHTNGLNASQELNAQPLYESITKYSVTVNHAANLLDEVVKAVEIAHSGIPGPVHVAIPINVQLELINPDTPIPHFPQLKVYEPPMELIHETANHLLNHQDGIIFIGQGASNAVDEVIELAERLNMAIITTPQAKGLIMSNHPLSRGVFGFAGHEQASNMINNGFGETLLVIGSSLGETATNNWNPHLTNSRFVIQVDIDETVFNRKYYVNIPIKCDARLFLKALLVEINNRMKDEHYYLEREDESIRNPHIDADYNSQQVLRKLQTLLPTSTRYTVDIGEFMSYVIHYMDVKEPHTFDINVHFGAMGTGIGAAIGSKLAEPGREIVCITGDGCFFMHGMEILTAKEYQLPILFVVMNNSRLGMVYHGHNLQYKRSHQRFVQTPVSISAMADSLGIPSGCVQSIADLTPELMNALRTEKGPSLLEIQLIDENIPPMGDRVKFLSSFGK